MLNHLDQNDASETLAIKLVGDPPGQFYTCTGYDSPRHFRVWCEYRCVAEIKGIRGLLL